MYKRQAPDLKRRIEPKKRRDFMSGTAGDDCHARAALALNAGQGVADSGVWARGEAIDTKGRERAVVIEQQNRAACGGKPCEESIEFFPRCFFLRCFFPHLWGQRWFTLPQSLTFAHQAILNCGILCTLFPTGKSRAPHPPP